MGLNKHNVAHTHNRFTAVFVGLPGQLVPAEIFRTSMVQGRKTEADTLTVRLDTTPSLLISYQPPTSPFFDAECPSCHNPPTVSWLGTGTKYAGLVWLNKHNMTTIIVKNTVSTFSFHLISLLFQCYYFRASQIEGIPPGGEFKCFRENWNHRLADSDHWNIDLMADLAGVFPGTLSTVLMSSRIAHKGDNLQDQL